MAQVPHGEKPVGVGTIQRNEQAKALAAVNGSPRFFSQTTLVVLSQLDLLRRTSRRICLSLLFRAGATDIWECAQLCARCRLTAKQTLERTMNYHVRIAPDWRGKVAVRIRPQGKVPLVCWQIDGSFLRPEQLRIYHARITCAVD